jgi:soluble lytic murein transglycosylase-like protein
VKFIAMIPMLPIILSAGNWSERDRALTALPVENIIIEEVAEPEDLALAGPLQDESSDGIPEDVPEDIGRLLAKYAGKYGLPLDVVIRLSEVESNHGEYARSVHTNFDGSYDIGILALNSNFIEYFSQRYYEGIPSEFNPYDPEDNIQTGLAYLAHLNRLTGGNLSSAVAAYNCGYRSMLTGEIPSSTKRYVNAVVYGVKL